MDFFVVIGLALAFALPFSILMSDVFDINPARTISKSIEGYADMLGEVREYMEEKERQEKAGEPNGD